MSDPIIDDIGPTLLAPDGKFNKTSTCTPIVRLRIKITDIRRNFFIA